MTKSLPTLRSALRRRAPQARSRRRRRPTDRHPPPRPANADQPDRRRRRRRRALVPYRPPGPARVRRTPNAEVSHALLARPAALALLTLSSAPVSPVYPSVHARRTADERLVRSGSGGRLGAAGFAACLPGHRRRFPQVRPLRSSDEPSTNPSAAPSGARGPITTSAPTSPTPNALTTRSWRAHPRYEELAVTVNPA